MANLPIEELRVQRKRVAQKLRDYNFREDVIKDFCSRGGQEPLGAFEAFIKDDEYHPETAYRIVVNRQYFWVGEIDGELSFENKKFLEQLGKHFVNCRRFKLNYEYKNGARWDYERIGECVFESCDVLEGPYKHWFCVVEFNPLTHRETPVRITVRDFMKIS